MRRILNLLCWIGVFIVVCLLTSSSTTDRLKTSSSYDVICVYESVSVPSGTKALDSWGSLKEVETLYVPTKIDVGKYSVELTRVDSNFYSICGTDYFIETRFCYEYALREEVVLNITSSYGYSRGEVVFF